MLPDVEAILLAYLRGHPLLAGVTVGSLRPADLRPLPLVVLVRAGGVPIGMWRASPVADRAGIAVQAWAEGQAGACDAARRALAALYAARTDRVVTTVSVLNGLAELPDADAPQGVHRYAFTVTVVVR